MALKYDLILEFRFDRLHWFFTTARQSTRTWVAWGEFQIFLSDSCSVYNPEKADSYLSKLETLSTISEMLIFPTLCYVVGFCSDLCGGGQLGRSVCLSCESGWGKSNSSW